MTETSERPRSSCPPGRIRYREAGEGKPVVFVHGYLVDGRLWDGVVDRALRSLPLHRPGLADRRPADRDEPRRRPLPLRHRGDRSPASSRRSTSRT